MTPEGRIKEKIDRVLRRNNIWFFKPVPTGMQMKTIDYICCINGRFVGIEAKAPGKDVTELQIRTMRLMRDAGGLTFVLSTPQEVDWFETQIPGIK